jgi:peptide/nickel transport system substrate-binding protein
MPHLRRVLVALALASILGAVGAQRAVVMQSADPNTLDPTQNRETPTFNALLNIYDALLFKNPDGSFAPSLAESWTATSDTTWEFELREGVRFHDGTAFDAEAVVYTIGRIQDEEAASPIAGGFAFIAEAVAEGPHRLRITTTRPTPLAEHYFSELLIVSPSAYEAAGPAAFASAPVGTGPYRFGSWTRDVELVLEGFEDHWRGAPAVPEVVFRPVPEAITRYSALAAGEADIIVQVPPSLVGSIEAAPNARLETVAGARVIYIGINTLGDNQALRDVRVREALNLAIDVDGIIEGIFDGLAVPTVALLTDVDFGFNAELEPYAYDPDRARDLLAEAGHGDGVAVALGTPSGRYVNDVQVAQAVAAQLEAVGFDVDLQVTEYGAYVGALFSGNAPDLFLIGWGNAPLDADFILVPLLRTDELLSYVSDDVLDALLDTGRTTVDREARLAAYREATARIHEQALVVPLYKQLDVYGVSDRIDWQPRTDEFIWMFSAAPTD